MGDTRGALFLITDHRPDPAAIADLACAFGIEVNNGYVMNRNILGRERPIVFGRGRDRLSDHLITRGRRRAEKVASIATFTGSAFRAGQSFQPLMILAPGRRSWTPCELGEFPPDTPKMSVDGWFQGAVATIEKGRIAVFSEAAMFTAQIFDRGRVGFGMNHPQAEDNAQFLLNVMHWLSGLL